MKVAHEPREPFRHGTRLLLVGMVRGAVDRRERHVVLQLLEPTQRVHLSGDSVAGAAHKG